MFACFMVVQICLSASDIFALVAREPRTAPSSFLDPQNLVGPLPVLPPLC